MPAGPVAPDLSTLPPSLRAAFEAQAEALAAERAARWHLEAEMADQKAYPARLETLLREMRRARFGPRSEKLGLDQLACALEELETAVKDDLRDMRLGWTLFVGDGGLYSKANLEELAKGAGKYILATPIRRIKEIRDEVLSHPGRYAEIAPDLRAKEVVIGDGERRRCYIICLNPEEV